MNEWDGFCARQTEQRRRRNDLGGVVCDPRRVSGGGARGDADDAGEVDGEWNGEGVSGIMWAAEGFGGGKTGLGGEWCRCPHDGGGLVVKGAANGWVVGGGVDFFVDGRMYVG